MTIDLIGNACNKESTTFHVLWCQTDPLRRVVAPAVYTVPRPLLSVVNPARAPREYNMGGGQSSARLPLSTASTRWRDGGWVRLTGGRGLGETDGGTGAG